MNWSKMIVIHCTADVLAHIVRMIPHGDHGDHDERIYIDQHHASSRARTTARTTKTTSTWFARFRSDDRKTCLAAVGLLVTMLLSSTVSAQSPAKTSKTQATSGSPSPAGASSTAGQNRRGGAVPSESKRDASSAEASSPQGKPSRGKKVISLEDEFLVEGKLEKPSAYYILRRSALEYDWARLDAHFTPLILESAQDPLF